MSEIRDRSVFRSSVIPSAKYCWSGSLLRLAKGSTTIDRRGATSGCAIDVVATTADVGAGFVAGQRRHVLAATTSARAPAAPIAARVMGLRRAAAISTLDGGRSAIASGR